MKILLNTKSLLQSNHFNLLKSQKILLSNWSCTLNLNNQYHKINTNEIKSFHKPFNQNVHKFHTNGINFGIVNKRDADFDSNTVSIYEGKFTSNIMRVKLFSLATSVMGLLAQPILWEKGQEVGGTGLGLLMCSIAGVFTFVTPLLLHFVMKKYVIDIKYNKEKDEYTCVTLSFFMFRNKVTFAFALISFIFFFILCLY